MPEALSELSPELPGQAGARIALACDHAGFPLKEMLLGELAAKGYAVLDLGTDSAGRSVDYPDFGLALARAVVDGQARFGVALCGSGIGISIAANRVPGARCALCWDHLSARLARQHNDANILAMGGRLLGPETARDILATFLSTPFEGGRHTRRRDKLG